MCIDLTDIDSQYIYCVPSSHNVAHKLRQTPTSQPITLISPRMCFSFKDLSPHGLLSGAERKEEREREKSSQERGRGLIYLNNLVLMKAVRARWGWIDGASGEKSGEQRVHGVKSNCRQIVGPDNGLNGPYKPLNLPPLSVCVHTYFCVCTVPNLGYDNHEFHMQLICVAIYLFINADIPV